MIDQGQNVGLISTIFGPTARCGPWSRVLIGDVQPVSGWWAPSHSAYKREWGLSSRNEVRRAATPLLTLVRSRGWHCQRRDAPLAALLHYVTLSPLTTTPWLPSPPSRSSQKVGNTSPFPSSRSLSLALSVIVLIYLFILNGIVITHWSAPRKVLRT
jgi:hypothetical protein